jgi:hypothetical protein
MRKAGCAWLWHTVMHAAPAADLRVGLRRGLLRFRCDVLEYVSDARGPWPEQVRNHTHQNLHGLADPYRRGGTALDAGRLRAETRARRLRGIRFSPDACSLALATEQTHAPSADYRGVLSDPSLLADIGFTPAEAAELTGLAPGPV